MNKKPQEQDLKKHFAAILGIEVADIDDATSTLIYRTGLWN